MKLKHHTTTIVLVALAALLTGVLLWDRGNVSTTEADKRTENIIEAWRPDDVTKIDFTIGERTLSLHHERDAEGQLDWALYEGEGKLDGDPLELTELAATLELAMFYRKIDDLDRSQLGLDQPRATFVVHMGQLTYTLVIGGEAPTPQGGAYVEVSGGTRGRVSYVVTKATLDELLIDPAELLNKRLVSLLSPSVASYTISSGSQRYELARGAWGGWTSGSFLLRREGMADVRANRFQLDQLTTAIGDIKAERFVPITQDDPTDAITISVTAIDAGEPKNRVVVGTSKACGEGEAYAIRREPNPVAGCIKARVLEGLGVLAGELVDRRVMGTDKGAVMELKLESGKVVVDLARKGEGWLMRKPTEGEAEQVPTEQLLDAMISAEGAIVTDPDLAALGLDKPRATVRILGLPERVGSSEQTEREEIIRIGAEIDGTTHVQRKDDGAVLALSAEVAARFLPRPTVLRRTRIFEEPVKYIRGLELDCGGRKQSIDRALDGSLTFVAPKNMETGVDGALALTLIDGVRELDAVRWVSEQPEERHGLDKPWCRVSLTLVEPDEADPTNETTTTRKLSVSLGAEAQGGYFAKADGDDAVFVAPRALGNAADMWLLSRVALIPLGPLGDAETITVRSGEKSLVVTKQGDSVKLVGGGSDALAVKVKDTLEQLTTEVAIARGPARAQDGFDAPLLTVEIKARDKDEVLTISVGRADDWRNTPVFHIRRSDIAVTYLISKARVQPLLDAL